MTDATREVWRVRPAGAPHEGRVVAWETLRQGIAQEMVGELDEVRGPADRSWLPVGEHPRTRPHVPLPTSLKVREEEDAESDLTPMIDVTFQLLIFFMITASFVVQKTLDMPKSEANSEGVGAVTMEELEEANIMVQLAGDGRVTVEGQVVASDNLVASLGAAASRKKSSEMVLDVADDALHDNVVMVLDAAGAAKIEHVHFVSRSQPGMP